MEPAADTRGHFPVCGRVALAFAYDATESVLYVNAVAARGLATPGQAHGAEGVGLDTDVLLRAHVLPASEGAPAVLKALLTDAPRGRLALGGPGVYSGTRHRAAINPDLHEVCADKLVALSLSSHRKHRLTHAEDTCRVQHFGIDLNLLSNVPRAKFRLYLVFASCNKDDAAPFSGMATNAAPAYLPVRF